MTCTRWHRLGELCECGHVTVPARFYWYDGEVKRKEERNQEEAEAVYMAFLKVEIPDLHASLDRPGPSWAPLRNSVTKPSAVGRPKEYRNAAERQKAYRARGQG